ncbi:MAG: hypothetical protein QOG43_3583 [Actinomycetota bacterium]|jgi:hypothetical protein|nr:hypothetical protein [Actinomycetota bacterium]
MSDEGPPSPPPVYGIVELATRIDKTPDEVEKWLEEGRLPPPTVLTIGLVWTGDVVEAWILDEVDVAAKARRMEEEGVRRAQEAKLRPRAWQLAGGVANAHARGLSEAEWLAEGEHPAARRIANGEDTDVVDAVKAANLWPWP